MITSVLVPSKVKVCNDSVMCVIVTYGDRRAILKRVLDAMKAQGVTKVVVVDNGAKWSVREELNNTYGEYIDVHKMGSNSGSASGYAAGIQRAMDLGAQFLWLIDDDNQPEIGALSELMTAYARLNKVFHINNLAVLAFRTDHQSDVAYSVPLWRMNPRTSSFWGFHIFDVPFKLWRRTSWGKPHLLETIPKEVELHVAPYSGLLFHRSLIMTHGLPRADFVLYGDDLEFTHRISRSGGVIKLVTSARLSDLEASWNVKRRYSSSIQGWLNGVDDRRVFYGARNSAYFDSHCRAHNYLMFAINRHIYCITLWVFAVVERRLARYQLLRNAIRNGLKGRLGLDPRYPL